MISSLKFLIVKIFCDLIGVSLNYSVFLGFYKFKLTLLKDLINSVKNKPISNVNLNCKIKCIN